ncbi:hypothetical protein KUTeg_000139 [Tegillarca granosa]|uniref:B box-type domain-containing protein n=1 Tax=Tegillarca granosa TaxID=220873 RepID=A0ABQ9FWP6_TEGGR|nr:hypothetical protein KUTeg_000139 [Tegillarca granosa]
MAAKTPTLDFQVAIKKCELCQEEDAQFYCNNCREEMCSGCKTAHLGSKVSSDHIVVSTKLGKSIGKSRKPIKCTTHQSEIIRIYCTSCDEAVCVKCVTDTKHENHKFEELETTLYRYQDEISQSISETKQQIEELQKSLHTIDVNVKDYTEVSDKTINEINQQRKQIKSDVDEIADDLVDQVEKQNQQDLKLMEKEKKDIQKIISDHNEYLRSCEEKLKSMKDISNIQHHIKKPQSNLPSITHINPPTFVSNVTPNLQDMFGRLVDSLETKSTQKMPKHEKDQKKQTQSDDSVSCTSGTTISTDIVSRINPGNGSKCVSAINDNEAWCGCDRDLVLIDIHGNVKRKIQLNKNVCDIAVTTKGEIFVTEWNGTNIKKYLQDDSCINIADTEPYETKGICLTSVQDEILVCLYKDNNSKVVRMTTAGQIKQSIQEDKKHQLLYKNPRYVAENINEDVVVVDGYYPSIIVLVNKKGKYRYKYPDSSQSSHRIDDCYSIACDNTGCILVSDLDNNRIHQIDMDGRFIQFILTQQHGVQIPRGLSIDNKVAIKKCELCQEEDAQFYCNDCQKEMYSGCKTAHLGSKASRSHNVLSTKLGNSIGKTRKQIKCTTHQNEIIRMYCTSCDKAVCVKCATDITHENHKFEELETTLYRYQDEISQSIFETKQQIEKLHKSLHTIDVNVKEYTEVSDKTINEINQQRKQIKSDIDKIADDLVDQVQKRKQQDLKLMEKVKKDIQKIISDHNEYLQSCEEKLKSMKDISNIQHHIKKPQSNLPSITHINPPTFVSNVTLNLQDMFGRLVDSLETKLTKNMYKHEKDQKKQTKSDDSESYTSVQT